MPQQYNQPRPRIPIDVERQVKVEAGHQCGIAHCEDPIFQLHHIDGNRENNDPANLIPLCGSHHARAHYAPRTQGHIAPAELRLYKQRLAELARVGSSQSFVRAEEARRVSAFTSIVRQLTAWHDGTSTSDLDDQSGYWFPREVYAKFSGFLEGDRYHQEGLRSYDSAVVAHQDAIVGIIRTMWEDVSGDDYIQTGYCFTYRPGPKGSPGFDERVDRQRTKFVALIRDLLTRLAALDAYVRWRPGD